MLGFKWLKIGRYAKRLETPANRFKGVNADLVWQAFIQKASDIMRVQPLSIVQNKK